MHTALADPLAGSVLDGRYRIEARIARGDWSEGRPIASETRLVQEYGIARTTVRRALDVLVEEQVVWKVQGRGTYVGQPPAEG